MLPSPIYYPSPRPLKKGINHMDFSGYRHLHKTFKPTTFSIKFVVEGEEVYHVNGRRYRVRAGEYLLINPACEGSVEINSRTDVIGLCININPELLSDVANTLIQPDPELRHYLLSEHFFENRYTAASTFTGQLLTNMESILKTDPACDQFPEEIFLLLAEKLVCDQTSVLKQLQSFQAVKQATRKELLRRLEFGKDYMLSCLTDKLQIAEVARESGLSEYHFFRLFKNVYRITPHQYLLEKRMEIAYNLLKNAKMSPSETAYSLGFGDVPTFSKAFKKRFGCAPSHLAGFDK